MINFLKQLMHWDAIVFGSARSPKWPSVRNAYLKQFPHCAICGGRENLIVHHKMPYHLFPTLELEPTNLMTLCEAAGMNCHITFGHLGNFKSYNFNVEIDADTWHDKITNRP